MQRQQHSMEQEELTGVVVVTTKNGENLKKPIINFRVEGAISQLTNVPKMVDGITYMRLYNEARHVLPRLPYLFGQKRLMLQ